MAKYEDRFSGDFEKFLESFNDGILSGSVSASYEDGSDYCENGIRCAVRVYERYSFTGSGRVSLAVTIIGNGSNIFVSAITTGSSKAVFFKVNTLGESSFLQNTIDVIKRCKEIANK